ncbi:MAG: hypothetical protein AB7I38_16120 [Dehalococcoidia bacterium]
MKMWLARGPTPSGDQVWQMIVTGVPSRHTTIGDSRALAVGADRSATPSPSV